MFYALVLSEGLMCALLAVAMAKSLAEADLNPEVDLGRRAWVAARFSMAQADALGPLFRHLVRAARRGLQDAHGLQEQIRHERLRRALPEPLARLLPRRRTARSDELVELRHLVEQLEQMGCALARYRAGVGRLMEVAVPLQCVQADRRARSAG